MNASRSAESTAAWYTLSYEKALEGLRSTLKGLDQSEVERRLTQYGPNRLKPPKRRGALVRLALQFHNTLIYVLLTSAIITALLGHWLDAGVIAGVVIINALIGFIQEGKAETALNAIRRMLSLHATVLRDRKRQQIPAADLVPGDLVFLQSGDKVPADLRLIQVRNLRIEEAALTGESESVAKSLEPVGEQAPIGDRVCMAYSGTLVTYGQGTGVVVATGEATEIGRISALLETVEPLSTPLLRQMATFGRWLTVAILALAASAFAFGTLLRDYSPSEMLLAAVGLAVAAIPEGLPAIMTITLAIGVQRMAQRHAIIRRLPAVETLGSVTVICSDKTGTLTCNEMTVQRVLAAEHTFEVSGSGYAPNGGFSTAGREVAAPEFPDLMELIRAGLLCNDALLRQAETGWAIEGDPTEGALLALAAKAGLDSHFEHAAWPRTDVIPFESEHRFMATLHHDHTGHGFVYVKGAPERVLEMCSKQRESGEDRPLRLADWQARMEETAALGHRLLAMAFLPMPKGCRELNFSAVEQGLTLLGMVGIADPPREEAIMAVTQCRQAGIGVKMITGDHAATARAIGSQLGLSGTALRGVELEQMNDEALRGAVRQADIFARASPEHKLRLVEALQANGEVTAMTGDGVNDAPALKRADVGVAMGVKGTEAAKEAAEMVLADDNFASITHAVEEGRTVYDNLRKAIVYILPTNGGEAGMVLIAILMGITLPITPVQILWVNMVTAVTLSLSLAFESPEDEVMRRPPRNPREPLLSGFFIWRIVFVSGLLVIGSLGLFLWETARGLSVEASRTMAVNTLVMGEVFYLFNCRCLTGSALSWKGFSGNRYVLAAIGLLLILQAAFTYAPLMNTLFGTAPLDTAAWWRITLFGLAVFLLVEAEKLFIRRQRPTLP